MIETRREGRVARVTLNRPEKRNALSLELCRALVNALAEAEADPEVGAILLAGNGKAFCAGIDLGEILQADAGAIDAAHEQLFTAGVRLTKPLIAAVHGPALAGGTGLVANCHIVLAADDATFGLTEIGLGLWPFVIFPAMAAALGERRATELSLTGRIFGAKEAREYGLAHFVVPAGELQTEARKIADEVANRSAVALRIGLEYVREIRGKDGREAGEIARRGRAEVFRSPGFREGVERFLARRNKVV